MSFEVEVCNYGVAITDDVATLSRACVRCGHPLLLHPGPHNTVAIACGLCEIGAEVTKLIGGERYDERHRYGILVTEPALWFGTPQPGGKTSLYTLTGDPNGRDHLTGEHFAIAVALLRLTLARLTDGDM